MRKTTSEGVTSNDSEYQLLFGTFVALLEPKMERSIQNRELHREQKMTTEMFYIDNLSFGTELEERVYDRISFDIIYKHKSPIHQVTISAPGALDSMNVNFKEFGPGAGANNGIIACLLVRAMINGKLKSKSAWTVDEINKLKIMWSHLIEGRMLESDCADDEMISPYSHQVQLIITAIVASGNSELFRFVSERLGRNGLNCTNRYDTGFWVDSFFRSDGKEIHSEMVDTLFRYWLSRVFIRVYSVNEHANDNIKPQFASLIHERLTTWAHESSENAEIVQGDLERYQSIFNNDNNGHTERQMLMHWFSIFHTDATEETGAHMPYMIRDRFLVIVFSRRMSMSYTGEKSKLEIAKKSRDPMDAIEALLSDEILGAIKITLKVVEEAGDWQVIGKSNSEEFIERQKLAQILCGDPKLSQDDINQYMDDKYCLNAAGIGADLEGVKRAYKEQKDISSKGTDLSI